MKKNSFLKNVVVLLFSQGIVKIAGVIYKLYLTNKTGYKDTGNALFLSAFQVYTVFLTICSIGVPNAISTLVASKLAIGESNSAYRVLKISVVIFGFIGFTTSTLLYFLAEKIAIFYLQIPQTSLVLKVLAPSIFIVAITAVLKGYFNGKQKMNITANSLSIEQIAKTLLTIVLIEILPKVVNNSTNSMVYTVGITTTLGNVISLTYILIKYYKSKQEIWTDILTSKTIKKERKITIVKSIFEVSCPIAVCALLGTLNKTIDAMTIVRITKEYLGEAEAIKQYGILSGKIESLIFFPLSFNMAFATVLIPYVSAKHAKGNKEDSKRLLKITIFGGILFGVPCFLILYFFPKEVLNILFPNACEGYLILKYSSISIIMTLLIQTINSYLQGIRKMKIQIFSIAIATIIKLILNIILLQHERLGIFGAIISNLVSYMCMLFVLIYYLIKEEKIKFETKQFLIKPVFLAIIMYNVLKVVYIINNIKVETIKLGSTIIIFILIYVTIVLKFRIFPREVMDLDIFGKHKTPKRLKINKN